jgi:Putative MetA-pathway of phenol degradation
MRRARFLLSLLVVLAPAAARAQSFNLRDLLTDFLRDGITLAPPPEGFPSHEAHFIGDNSPQFLALKEFSSQVAYQLSSFPLASSAGGFAYRFDPSLGVLTRVTDSFGPIYAERVDTVGKGRFNLGLNYSHFTFDTINTLHLRDGDLRLVFTHEDANRDGSTLSPFFEGDLITAQLLLDIETDITAFVLTYGVTDRFDIGVAVPIVRTEINAATNASINRLATGTIAPGIHRFLNGESTETFRQSGSASGLGDIVLRTKYRFLEGSKAGLAIAADARVPTGDENDLLGTGATELKAYIVGSAHLGTFSPHLNAGYSWSIESSSAPQVPDEIAYTGGFDWALSPRFTFIADVVGRTLRNVQNVEVVDTTFQANASSDPANPNIVSAVLPRLVTQSGDITTILGSIGVKINPFGNFLLTLNGLFPLNDQGLQDGFTPLVGIDYSF